MMLYLTDVTTATEQLPNVFTEIYTTPVAIIITLISLAFAATCGIAHKFIKWFHEKDIPKLRIATCVFTGISVIFSVGGLFVTLNITSPLAYGFSAGAFVVLMFYCVGSNRKR